MVAEIASLPSCLPGRGRGRGEDQAAPSPGASPRRAQPPCGKEAADDLMEAALVTHGPDHVSTSLGVGKRVGPRRCNSAPMATLHHGGGGFGNLPASCR